jgi:hypothetical protein
MVAWGLVCLVEHSCGWVSSEGSRCRVRWCLWDRWSCCLPDLRRCRGERERLEVPCWHPCCCWHRWQRRSDGWLVRCLLVRRLWSGCRRGRWCRCGVRCREWCRLPRDGLARSSWMSGWVMRSGLAMRRTKSGLARRMMMSGLAMRSGLVMRRTMTGWRRTRSGCCPWRSCDRRRRGLSWNWSCGCCRRHGYHCRHRHVLVPWRAWCRAMRRL